MGLRDKRLTVIEAVEHVQKHGAYISRRRPIHFDVAFSFDFGSGVVLLEGVTSSPDDCNKSAAVLIDILNRGPTHGDNEEDHQGRFRSHRSPRKTGIQSVSENPGAKNLARPV